MYEWIEEVDNLIQTLEGEKNDNTLRVKITKDIIDILNKHKVNAKIDCSTSINTGEVVIHGGFRAMVETPTISFMFKYIRKKGEK